MLFNDVSWNTSRKTTELSKLLGCRVFQRLVASARLTEMQIRLLKFIIKLIEKLVQWRCAWELKVCLKQTTKPRVSLDLAINKQKVN
jgi:hypothetical protein